MWRRVTTHALGGVGVLLALGASFTLARQTAPPESFEQRVPGATATLTMVRVPGASLEIPDPVDPAKRQHVEIKPFFIASTETTWDLYDLFVFRLADEGAPAPDKGEDAVTRPSKPYIPPDRGFGHAGYPAISMTYKGAEEFCAWLSARTGRAYRLPTEQEWEHACRAGAIGSFSFPDSRITEYAWFAENAGNKTHPVAARHPNPWGLYDVHGNVAEWAVGSDGKPVTCGGSYLDPADRITAASRAAQAPSWNESDPQFPKSRWWLADCTFVGFRVVCDIPEAEARK
jgi:formylglycine-generating enzyme required for sulfatase activity